MKKVNLCYGKPVLAAGVLGLLVISGTGTVFAAEEKGQEKLTLMMYTSAEIQAKIEKELEPFEEENGCTVETILVPLADYDSKLSTMIASNEAPDVLWVAEKSTDQYISQGILADITEITQDTEWDWEDFAEGQRAHWTSEDKVYGLPFSGAPIVCFYNKSLYEKAGLATPTELYESGEWTVDKMIEQAYELSELGEEVYGIDFSRMGNWTNWDVVGTTVLRLYGGDAWNDSDHSQILINSEDSVKGLDAFNRMLEDGVHAKAGTTVDFTTGQLGLWCDLYSQITKLANVEFEWDVVPMPDNQYGWAASWSGSAAYAVYEGTPNRELAEKLVKYITGKEAMGDLAFDFVSPRKSILYGESFATGNNGEYARSSDPEAHARIIDAIDKVHTKLSHEQNEALSSCIQEAFELMYAGEMNAKEAADYAAELMESYIG